MNTRISNAGTSLPKSTSEAVPSAAEVKNRGKMVEGEETKTRFSQDRKWRAKVKVSPTTNGGSQGQYPLPMGPIDYESMVGDQSGTPVGHKWPRLGQRNESKPFNPGSRKRTSSAGSRGSKRGKLIDASLRREFDQKVGETVVKELERQADYYSSSDSASQGTCCEGDITRIGAGSCGRYGFHADRCVAPVIQEPVPEAPPLDPDTARLERALLRERAVNAMRGLNFHYYTNMESWVKRRVQVTYVRHHTIPRHSFVDLRVDQMRQVQLSHEDPLHAWFEIKQVDCLLLSESADMYIECGRPQRSTIEVSYEYLVQLLGPGAFNLAYGDEMMWERITASSRGLSSVNINRYTPPLIVANSVALAHKFCLWMTQTVFREQGFRLPQRNVEQSNMVIGSERSSYRNLARSLTIAEYGLGVVLTMADDGLCACLWGIMLLGQVILKPARHLRPQRYPELPNVWPALRPRLMDKYCLDFQFLSNGGARGTLPRWNRIQMLALRLGLQPLIILRRARIVFGERMMISCLGAVIAILGARYSLKLLSKMSLTTLTSTLVGFTPGLMPIRSLSGLFLSSLNGIFSTSSTLLSMSPSWIGRGLSSIGSAGART